MSKPIYHYDIEQGSEDWLKARLGIVTASEVNHILTATGKPASNEGQRSYACQIAAERELGYIEDHYESFDMMRGHFQEGIAREVYNDNYDEVKECGLITRKFNGITLGASPDGLVGDDGGIEIKSRLSKFQIKTIISGEVPKDYYNQIQALLMVSGREWFDFVQYSNGMPLYVQRVYPDMERQQCIADALVEFEKKVEETISNYKERANGLIKTERVEITFEDDIILESN